MKTIILAAAAAQLIELVFAQPHGHKHIHLRADLVQDVVTDIVTVTAPEIIVWVDNTGSTVSVETRTPIAVAATPATTLTQPISSVPVIPTSLVSLAAPTISSDAPVQAYPSSSSAVASTEAPSTVRPTSVRETSISIPTQPPAATGIPAPSLSAAATAKPLITEASDVRVAPPPTQSDTAPQPSATDKAVVQAGPGSFGITWEPYNTEHNCKSESQIDSELASLAGYSMIRVYTTDCNALSLVLGAAQQYGFKVFAGIVDISAVSADLNAMVLQAGTNMNLIDTIFIGNELVQNGAAVSDVVAALGIARGILQGQGYTGAIVTVDTFDTILANEGLCQNSDYCAANCHAFFDDTIDSAGAGAYVAQQAQLIAAMFNKKVVITESGWPYQGMANGAAVPSVADQQAAIQSLQSAFSSNPSGLILFDSFDCQWKDPGPFQVEQFFGINHAVQP